RTRSWARLRTRLYFAGAGAGAGVVGAGAGAVGAGAAGADAGACGARPPTTDPVVPRCPRIPSTIAPITNSSAHTVVARDSTVAPLRAPNAAWLDPPPKALAMS